MQPNSLQTRPIPRYLPETDPAFPRDPKIFYVDPPTALIGVHKSQTVTLVHLSFGSFTLTEIDSGTHSDSDSRPNGYIGLYRIFHIAQTRTWIPTPDFCTGQEAESESTPESISCNVNEALDMNRTSVQHHWMLRADSIP